MENEPIELQLLAIDFKKVSNKLCSLSQIMTNNNFDFRIFFAADKLTNDFPLFIKKKEVDNEFNYYASYLDLFIDKKIIQNAKKKYFIENFKDPNKFCCLMVSINDFLSIVYLPYSNL